MLYITLGINDIQSVSLKTRFHTFVSITETLKPIHINTGDDENRIYCILF